MKLFVAYPSYNGLTEEFVRCLLRTTHAKPCAMELRDWPGDSAIGRARNNCAAEFLSSDCTDLLFIDTDLIFSPDHIARIVSHDVDIVGGCYPKKQKQLSWVLNTLEGHASPDPDTGLQRVRYMGTGFLRIRRSVFERMIEAYPEIAYRPDAGEQGGDKHDFFTFGVYRDQPDKPGRYLSEDWYFCQRVIDLGINIYADTRIVLKHVGKAIYPLEDIGK
jgi:hypothetical protein